VSLAAHRITAAENASSNLYDAAVGLVDWSEALQAVAAACGGDGAVLFCRANSSDPRIPTGSADIDPQNFLSSYLSHFKHRDPWAERLTMQARRMTGLFVGEELVSDTELLKTPHYNEVFKRHDVRRLLSMGVPARSLQNAPEVLLSVTRGVRSSSYSSDDRSIAEILLPHVDSAVNLYTRSQLKVFSHAEEILEKMEGAVAIVGRNRKLLSCNSAFKLLIDRKKSVRLSRGKLEFFGQAAQIGVACDRFVGAEHAMQFAPAFCHLPATHFESPYTALVAHVPPLLTKILRLRAGSAIVKICERPQSLDGQRDAFSNVFGLTSAETKILGFMLTGRSVEEVSVLTGLSALTVRTHFKAIYGKSGLHRQAEVVAYALTNFNPRLDFPL
jgi:DNA-binding CsgD family transcriptional regulator